MSHAVPLLRRIISRARNGAGKNHLRAEVLLQVAAGHRIRQCRSNRRRPLFLAPEQAASRLFLQQIKHHPVEGRDFAFETTLSGRGYLRLVRRLRLVAGGWNCSILLCRA